MIPDFAAVWLPKDSEAVLTVETGKEMLVVNAEMMLNLQTDLLLVVVEHVGTVSVTARKTMIEKH